MIENILGWLIILAFPIGIVFGIVKARRAYERYTLKRDQEETKRAEAIAKYQREQVASWTKRKESATHVGKTTYDYNLDKSRTTVTDRETKRQVSYVHETNGSPDLLTTLIVADMLFNNKESSAGTVSWKDDVPSIDTDDRKSFSYSSSDTSSSDGPSYSDSGPSSDW